MTEIRLALVTLPWPKPLLRELSAALAPAEVICVHRFDAPRIARVLRRADVAFIAGDLDERIVRARCLKWVHCGHAGLDRSVFREVFERGLLVTSAAGRSAPALAEHAMFFMLALSFRYPRFFEAQRTHRWGVRGQHELKALCGQTLGIVGLGHIGIELAKRAKAFDMGVLAYRRRALKPRTVDRLYSVEHGDELSEMLAESDYVVLALPLSDQTYHLIGQKELTCMRQTAHLVNIARGGLVDEQALAAALLAGQLAGAAVDVVEDEPLPSDSPLWEIPNLLITPHVTPQLPDREERALAILLENVQRYRAGRPMLNRLTTADVFSQRPTMDFVTRSAARSVVSRIEGLSRRVTHWWRTR